MDTEEQLRNDVKRTISVASYLIKLFAQRAVFLTLCAIFFPALFFVQAYRLWKPLDGRWLPGVVFSWTALFIFGLISLSLMWSLLYFPIFQFFWGAINKLVIIYFGAA